MNKKGLWLAIGALVIVVLAAIGLSSTQITGPVDKQRSQAAADPVERPAVVKATSQVCGSNGTYARLKEVAFEEAFRLRNDDPADLDTLAANSVVRMENPVVKSSDDGTGTTLCAGRFVLELPPGAERGFGGERRLAANVEYAAQTAADGSGLVYQLNGADAIIQRLAAFTLTPAPAPIQPGQIDLAEVDRRVIPDEVAVPTPTPIETPESRPTPSPNERAEARPTPRPRPTAVAEADPPRRTSRPSFDCRFARTRGEIMVCESSRLAARDRAMSSEFYQALANSDPRTRRELRRSRDRFLAYRDRCRDEACVAEAYDGRVREIRDIVELAPQ